MARAKKNAEEWSGVRKLTRSSEEIELHIPLLRKMIALYDYGNALSYDEKFAAGLVGIAIALERYRPELNVKLSYWISFQIDCQIRMETRRAVTQRKFCPQSDSDELLFDPAEEPSETDAERAAREDSAETLKRLMFESMAILPKRQRHILESLYLKGKTQREVAKELGVAQSWVSRLAKSALDKVKREIAGKADALGVSIEGAFGGAAQ